MPPKDNRDCAPLGDDFWAALSAELKRHDKRPKAKVRPAQPPAGPSNAIREWHGSTNQEQTCQMADSGNPDAIRHVHQCIDCKTHYHSTRGRDFDHR